MKNGIEYNNFIHNVTGVMFQTLTDSHLAHTVIWCRPEPAILIG